MHDLAPHQQAALKKMKNGCILWGGVGSGKGRVALAYYLDKETPESKLIVITTAKKRDSKDWEREAAQMVIGKKDATIAGELIVDSWNNIGKYIEERDAFFVFDEQRLVGSGMWTKSFLKIAKHNDWIMLSATPGDTWLDYIPVFIANGFYKNRSEFKREHVVYNSFTKYPKVDRYLGVGRLVRHRNDILVHMPYAKETVRRSKPVWVEYDQEVYHKVAKERWNVYEGRPIRQAAEHHYVLRRVVNADRSRLEAIHQILQKHPRVIIFYNWNYELMLLRELGSVVPIREWNGHKHEEIPDLEKWVYLVQYTAGAEGWNCTSTDCATFYSLPSSYKIWEQSQGRIDRLNTDFKDLYYYILRSKAPLDFAIWRALMSKKNFNETAFVRNL